MTTLLGSPHGDSEKRQQSPPDGPEDEPNPRFHRVPLIRIEEDPEEGFRLVGTGRGEWVDRITIRQKYGVDPSLLRDFLVAGDSMSDTLRPGDQIRTVLAGSYPPNDGAICILRAPVCLFIRRVRLAGTEVVLVADNPEVPDLRIDQAEWNEDYEQIARVLEVRRSV